MVLTIVKKSGNTTITSFLADLEGDHGFTSTKEIKKSARLPVDCSFTRAIEIRRCKYLTVVRNPYSRILSAYLDKVGRGYNHDSQRSMAKFEKIPGFGSKTPLGFSQFVGYLDHGGLFGNQHWWPQVSLLIMPANQFDFVCQVEQLVAQFSEVLKDLQIDPQKASTLIRPHKLELMEKQKITGAEARLSEFYTEESAQKIQQLYEEDFRTFGYNPAKCILKNLSFMF